jgi:hypothetical protein
LCVLYSTLLHLPPLQIPLCQRILGSNPGLWRLWHWQSDALTSQLDLIHCRLDLVHSLLVLIHIIIFSSVARVSASLLDADSDLTSHFDSDQDPGLDSAFTLMRIRILLLIKVKRICYHWSTDPPGWKKIRIRNQHSGSAIPDNGQTSMGIRFLLERDRLIMNSGSVQARSGGRRGPSLYPGAPSSPLYQSGLWSSHTWRRTGASTPFSQSCPPT